MLYRYKNTLFPYMKKYSYECKHSLFIIPDLEKFGDFRIRNNIVNALTQYVNPKDSAESSVGMPQSQKG